MMSELAAEIWCDTGGMLVALRTCRCSPEPVGFLEWV